MSCIVILGMHRSGTSCLTGTLQQCGVELGEVHVKNPFNRRGNREHPAVMQLNDEVLLFNEGSWDRPVIARNWNREHESRRTSALDSVRATSAEHWGFKDPRTLFTLPFWLEALPADTRFIATFRHPVAVAGSLSHRNKFTTDQGIALWKAYNLRLLELCESRPLPIVNFDLDPTSYKQALARKMSDLGFAVKATKSSDFFDPALRNQPVTTPEQDIHDAEARDIYQELLRRASV